MKLIVLKNNVPLSEVSVETSDFDEMYEIYVGRSEDCHVQIDDPLISRHHFVLKNQNSNWYCEKLSQLGVITLNGSLVTKSSVSSGDEIKCGSYSVIIADLPKKQTIAEEVVPGPVHIPEPTHELRTEIMAPPKKALVLDTQPIEELPQSLDELNSYENVELSPEQDRDNLGSLDSLNENNDLHQDFNSDNTEGLEGDENFSGDVQSNSSDLTVSDDQANDFGVSTTDGNSDVEESTRFFKAFVNYQLVLFGEHAPYDRFQLDLDEVFIGRDPKKCQIILNDPEVSSVHAVIRKTNIDVTLEDLNSSNGTILNGERINKAHLTAGDEFVIGGTSFTLEVRSDLLESESDRLMPVEKNQFVETEEIIDEEIAQSDDGLDFNGDTPQEKSIIKRIMKDPAKRKKAIYSIVGVALLYIFLAPDEQVSAPKKQKPKEAQIAVDPNASPKLNLSKEQENARNVFYELGVSYFEQSRYDLAQVEFQKVVSIDPDYKKVQSYLEQTNVALKRIEELEAQKRAEEDRIKLKKQVEEWLVKAREATKQRQVQVAESLFNQIIEKDPENIEVSQLRLELESWQKEEERKALELAAKEAARKKMVDSLTPAKTIYFKKEWYRAILRLEEFLRIKGMDEDLVKDASDMLSDAKNQLASELGPLLGKARSLKEGQDLKAAYEAYLDILKVEPTNSEALNEVDDIKTQLDSRSKRIYREAIIAESLSLFADAKEKFQEVQQISPTDSEYYKKASEKLKNYLE